jgi:hypothetical protein
MSHVVVYDMYGRVFAFLDSVRLYSTSNSEGLPDSVIELPDER